MSVSSLTGQLALSSLSKVSSISVLNPGHIALRVKGNVGRLGFQPFFPVRIGLVGIYFLLCIVAFQIQDLVGIIGLAFEGICDGNATGFRGGSRTLLGKSGSSQSHNHSQCQDQAQNFSAQFHNKYPFFFFHTVLDSGTSLPFSPSAGFLFQYAKTVQGPDPEYSFPDDLFLCHTAYPRISRRC